MLSKRVKIILVAVVLLLLIPLVAMQLTDSVSWNAMDFLIMAILLLGVGTLFEIILRKVPKFRTRVVLGIVLFLAFLLVWAELAVGIFGTPFSGS